MLHFTSIEELGSRVCTKLYESRWDAQNKFQCRLDGQSVSSFYEGRHSQPWLLFN